MNAHDLPLTRDVVLIGGGHTHALVLRRWGMDPLPGARLTLINPGPTAPYSGMLPGHVAGHYDRAALDIDLVRLARFAGARLILGAADGIDRDARTVSVPGRPPVAFDVLSIDVGVTSAMPALPGFAEHGVPAKPLGPFAARWQTYLSADAPGRVAVIGAGVAGVELAMAMAHALRQRNRAASVTLIDNAAALSVVAPASCRRLLRALTDQGVTLREHVRIARIDAHGVTLNSDETIPAEFVTGAAGARPHGWLADTGLALTDGFVDVGPTLQSSDPAILAVGDCAHMTHAPRPKAGVYAVRQAPVAYHNLRALAAGEPLRRYTPQNDYLKLISLGEKSALGERFGVPLAGPMMWRWKDRIDQAFMDRFRNLPAMERPVLPLVRAQGVAETLGPKPMCGGCGAKVGHGALAGVAEGFDDAAVLDGNRVISTDHLRSLWADPVVMTRIAAVHALGDVWAMGAAPEAVLSTIILPRLSTDLQARMLAEIDAAARGVVGAAGAKIVGGHTSIGTELTVGFSVTGRLDGPAIGLGGAQPGDALILTKPLGSGVIMAAEMAGKAQGAWVADALDLMQQAQGAAAQILRGHAHAMTDITGFGLAGHLGNICRASGCAARLRLAEVPIMTGADALADAGERSTLFAENRRLAPNLPDGGKADLLFDPQTAGGLLAAVPEDVAAALLGSLKNAGYPAAIIGEIITGNPEITLRD